MKNLGLRLLNVKDMLPTSLVSQDRDRTVLTGSVSTHGILQNPCARPHPKRKEKWEIVFGAGRWKEAKRAGIKQLWVLIVECDDKELLLLNAIENFGRTNLTRSQQAELFRKLLEAGYSTRELEKLLGISDSQIVQVTKTDDVLSEQARKAVDEGLIAPSIFEVARTVKDPVLQGQVINDIVKKDLGLDSTIQLVKGVQPTSEAYANSPEEYKQPKKSAIQPEDLTFLVQVEHGLVVEGEDGSMLVRDAENHRDRDLIEELRKAWLKLREGDSVEFLFRHTTSLKQGAYTVSREAA
jgi:ParB/RepB/Spo0J family partition protein